MYYRIINKEEYKAIVDSGYINFSYQDHPPYKAGEAVFIWMIKEIDSFNLEKITFVCSSNESSVDQHCILLELGLANDLPIERDRSAPNEGIWMQSFVAMQKVMAHYILRWRIIHCDWQGKIKNVFDWQLFNESGDW